MFRLTLFSRHGCHLCDVMQQELAARLQDHSCEVVIEDVDSREDWRRQYGEIVPVLMDASGREICRYHLDEQALSECIGCLD